MNTWIDQEKADSYLEELQQLNHKYGFGIVGAVLYFTEGITQYNYILPVSASDSGPKIQYFNFIKA